MVDKTGKIHMIDCEGAFSNEDESTSENARQGLSSFKEIFLYDYFDKKHMEFKKEDVIEIVSNVEVMVKRLRQVGRDNAAKAMLERAEVLLQWSQRPKLTKEELGKICLIEQGR